MLPVTGTDSVSSVAVSSSTRQAKNNRKPVRRSDRPAILYFAVMTRLSPPGAALLLDPFIDPREEKATRHYLTRVGHAVAQRETWRELLPDPATFRRAAAYYQVAIPPPRFPREVIPEVDS